MDTLVTSRNITEICYQIPKLKYSAKKKIVVDIIKLFCKMFIDDKNTYVARFISNRLNIITHIHIDKKDIFYKLITEVYVFLATINHPECKPRVLNKKKSTRTSSNDIELYKQILILLRNQNETYECICQLYDCHSDFLWKFVRIQTTEQEFCKSLEQMFALSNQKLLLFAAYDTLFNNKYIYNSSVYNNIVFQCMLKIPYLVFEDDLERNIKLYKTCLSYVPKIKNTEQNNTIENKQLDPKTVHIINKKNKKYKPVFEKTCTHLSSHYMNQSMNHIEQFNNCNSSI